MSSLQDIYGWDYFIYALAEKKIFDRNNGEDSITNVELTPAFDLLRYAGYEERKNLIINEFYDKK